MKPRRKYQLPNDGINRNRIEDALRAGCKSVAQIMVYTGLGRSKVSRLLVQLNRADILPRARPTPRAPAAVFLSDAQRIQLFEQVKDPTSLFELRHFVYDTWGIDLHDVTLYRLMKLYEQGKPLTGRKHEPKTRKLTDEDLNSLTEQFLAVGQTQPSYDQIVYAIRIMRPELELSRASIYNYARKLHAMILELSIKRTEIFHTEPPVL